MILLLAAKQGKLLNKHTFKCSFHLLLNQELFEKVEDDQRFLAGLEYVPREAWQDCAYRHAYLLFHSWTKTLYWLWSYLGMQPFKEHARECATPNRLSYKSIPKGKPQAFFAPEGKGPMNNLWALLTCCRWSPFPLFHFLAMFILALQSSRLEPTVLVYTFATMES